MKEDKQKLLVIAAHPDDEVLGCAASVHAKVKQGWRAELVLLTGGVAGRVQLTDTASVLPEQERLQTETQQAAEVIGFTQVHHLNFPDNRLDTVSRNDISLAIKEILHGVQPALVYTHHASDYNWDHCITFDAVMMAARANYPDSHPAEILAFEVLSSTERAWQSADRAFLPTVYVDVADTIAVKKAAMLCYESECRAYPHPRSVEAIEYLARKRGCEVGLEYAECFELIRRIEK